MILISLKDKLVDSYIDSKLSNNNSKDLFNNFKQIGPDGKVSREFIEWFVGFTDAEGCFYFILNNVNHLKFSFIIELHKDDVKILDKICKILGIGKVIIYGNSARFYVSNPEDLLKVIIPIFKEFPLQTTKYLDFVCFEQAINIRSKTGFKGSLSQQDKNTIIKLKESMNSNRFEINAEQAEI